MRRLRRAHRLQVRERRQEMGRTRTHDAPADRCRVCVVVVRVCRRDLVRGRKGEAIERELERDARCAAYIQNRVDCVDRRDGGIGRVRGDGDERDDAVLQCEETGVASQRVDGIVELLHLFCGEPEIQPDIWRLRGIQLGMYRTSRVICLDSGGIYTFKALPVRCRKVRPNRFVHRFGFIKRETLVELAESADKTTRDVVAPDWMPARDTNTGNAQLGKPGEKDSGERRRGVKHNFSGAQWWQKAQRLLDDGFNRNDCCLVALGDGDGDAFGRQSQLSER